MNSHTPPRWQYLKTTPQLKHNLISRQKTLQGIRAFFAQENFLEVDTPLLAEFPGTEPYLELFPSTLTTSLGHKLAGYLLTSPEYAMKKLLVAGYEKIFTICKSFRNGEGLGPYHNHEFTIMEWYRAGATYLDLMEDCQNLIRSLAQLHTGQQEEMIYQGKTYSLAGQWPRYTVPQLFEAHCQIPQSEILQHSSLLKAAQQLGLNSATDTSWDDLFTLLFVHAIDPWLAQQNQPVFIIDYPLPQAALSKRSTTNPNVAERVELFIGGLELANGFSELTDAAEQEARLREELALKHTFPNTVSPTNIDEDFTAALKAGMPEAAGIALGVDRLVALFADVASIKEVITFPIEDAFPSLTET